MTPAILQEMIRGGSPEVDLAVYLEPAFAAAFASALDEGFVRGPDGYARDTLLAMQRWPFDPAEIRPAVHLWYGRFDASPFHSPDLGASLARRIPGAARTVVEGAGGSILWTHGSEILEALLEARHRAGTWTDSAGHESSMVVRGSGDRRVGGMRDMAAADEPDPRAAPARVRPARGDLDRDPRRAFAGERASASGDWERGRVRAVEEAKETSTWAAVCYSISGALVLGLAIGTRSPRRNPIPGGAVLGGAWRF